MKPADVCFYFDADILGLAHVICSLRSDSTYPGDPGAVIKRRARPACGITPGIGDNGWIPEVAGRGWVGITRDSAIQTHLSLMQAVKDHGLRLVALAGPDAVDKWAQLEVIMTQWRKIEALRLRTGPLVMTITRTSARELDIDKCLNEIREGRREDRQSGKPKERRDRQSDDGRLF